MNKTKRIELELLAPSFGSSQHFGGASRRRAALLAALNSISRDKIAALVAEASLPDSFHQEAARYVQSTPGSGIGAAYAIDAMKMLQLEVQALYTAQYPLRVAVVVTPFFTTAPWIDSVVVHGETFGIYELPAEMAEQIREAVADVRQDSSEDESHEAAAAAA